MPQAGQGKLLFSCFFFSASFLSLGVTSLSLEQEGRVWMAMPAMMAPIRTFGNFIKRVLLKNDEEASSLGNGTVMRVKRRLSGKGYSFIIS